MHEMLSALGTFRYTVTVCKIALPGNDDRRSGMAQTTMEREASYRARRPTTGEDQLVAGFEPDRP